MAAAQAGSRGFPAAESTADTPARTLILGGKHIGMQCSGNTVQAVPLQSSKDRPDRLSCRSYLMALTEGRSTEDEARVKAAWERQARIETDAVKEAIRRWKDEMASMRRAGAVDRHPTAISMMLKWFEPLSESIAAEQQQASSQSYSCRSLQHCYDRACCAT